MADVDDRLWATPLEEQRRRDAEDVREPAEPATAVEPDPAPPPAAEQPEPPPAPRRADLRPLVVVGVVALVLGIALGVADRGSLGLTTILKSAWTGNQKMRCETARFEDRQPAVGLFGSRPRAVEFFTCHATGGRTLPPGAFTADTAPWDSDFTRVSARDSRIVITPDGTLTGWAVY